MDSASSPLLKSSEPSKPRPDSRAALVAVFLGALGILGVLTVWIIANGYMSPDALSRWSKTLTILAADQIRIENLGLSYPHIPYYLLMPFYYVPGLRSGAACYFVANFFGALALVVWYSRLRRADYSRELALTCVSLIAIHPFFLWSVTSGGRKPITLLVFYLLCAAIEKVPAATDSRPMMAFAGLLMVFFFTDERCLYVFAALAPLLALMMPRELLHKSPVAFYQFIAVPLVVAFLSWAYLNWIYDHEPWKFLRDQESAFRGAWSISPWIEWLRRNGGKVVGPIVWSVCMTLISCPVTIAAAARGMGERQRLRLALVCAVPPVFATVIATTTFMLSHPVEMLFLLMACIPVMLGSKAVSPQVALPALLMGITGGWFTFTWAPTPDLSQWRDALVGIALPERFEGERALGVWLNEHRLPTLMDDRAGYPAIVARGDAIGMLLPFSRDYKSTMLTGKVSVAQVAVPNPQAGDGYRDQLTYRIPGIYENGQPGYDLVYDFGNWRVYRRAGEVQSAGGL